MQRKSLLEGDEFEGIGRALPAASGTRRASAIKLLIAAGLIIAAAGVYSVNLGLFESPQSAQVSPELQHEREERTRQEQEELQKLVRDGKVKLEGA